MPPSITCRKGRNGAIIEINKAMIACATRNSINVKARFRSTSASSEAATASKTR